jgi:hypothetical protein
MTLAYNWLPARTGSLEGRSDAWHRCRALHLQRMAKRSLTRLIASPPGRNHARGRSQIESVQELAIKENICEEANISSDDPLR